MRLAIGPALIVLGIVLVIFGVRASQSLGSDVSRFFTGNPTDRAVWLLIGGGVAIVAGLGTGVVTLRSKRA